MGGPSHAAGRVSGGSLERWSARRRGRRVVRRGSHPPVRSSKVMPVMIIIIARSSSARHGSTKTIYAPVKSLITHSRIQSRITHHRQT